MMRVVHQWVIDSVYAHVTAAGYVDLTPTCASIFRYPTPDGLRPSQLAGQLQVTKQSVNDVLRELEALGYLKRVRDPTDGRARIIRLTAKGRRLERVVYDGAQAAADGIAALLGPRAFEQLHDSLERTVQAIADGQISPHSNHAPACPEPGSPA